MSSRGKKKKLRNEVRAKTMEIIDKFHKAGIRLLDKNNFLPPNEKR